MRVTLLIFIPPLISFVIKTQYISADSPPLWEGLLYVFIILFANMVETLAFNHSFYPVLRFSNHVQVA